MGGNEDHRKKKYIEKWKGFWSFSAMTFLVSLQTFLLTQKQHKNPVKNQKGKFLYINKVHWTQFV